MRNPAAEAHARGASREAAALIARLDAMAYLRPLEEAASIINCYHEANGLPGWYSVDTLLSLASRGEVRITVCLPNAFIVHRENDRQPFADTPIRPVFPAQSDFLCIERGTAYGIYQVQGGSVELKSALHVKLDGTTDRFVAAKPYAHISLADLRVGRDEIIRIIRDLPDATGDRASDLPSNSAPQPDVNAAREPDDKPAPRAASAVPAEAGLSMREKQIRAIEAEADRLGFPRMSIPKGGKKRLEGQCMERYANLFGAGPDPFKDSWSMAVSKSRIRTTDHDKHGGK